MKLRTDNFTPDPLHHAALTKKSTSTVNYEKYITNKDTHTHTLVKKK